MILLCGRSGLPDWRASTAEIILAQHCFYGRLSRSDEPLIAVARRNRNRYRGRYRSRGSAYTFVKNILYFVIDPDCDSEPDPEPRFLGVVDYNELSDYVH